MRNNVLSRILKVFSTTLFLYYSLFYFSFHVSDEIILWEDGFAELFCFFGSGKNNKPLSFNKKVFIL